MRPQVQCAPLAVLLTSLLPAVQAAFNTTCPAAITNGNATGTVLFSDPIIRGQNTDLNSNKQYTDDTSYLLSNDTTVSLASTNLSYTLSVSTTQTELDGQTLPAILSALSVSTDGINLLNDLPSTSFAACALPILNLPELTTRYGQSDTGNCEATLPYGCVGKILDKVLEYKLTYNPVYGSLHGTCADFGDLITNSYLAPDGSNDSVPVLPSECTNLFRADNKGPGPLVSKVQGFAITSENDTTPLSQQSTFQCPSVSPQLSGNSVKSYPFFNVSTQYNSDSTIASGGSYDEAVRTVYPIITVFFHGMNSTFFGYIPAVSASMSCVRVNEFSQGSRVSDTLQPATPPSLGLSTGAKVGIAIAVIVAVAVAAAVVWAVYFRNGPAGGGRGARKDYGQPRWYQSPAEVFRRGGARNASGMEKSEYEMMTKPVTTR